MHSQFANDRVVIQTASQEDMHAISPLCHFLNLINEEVIIEVVPVKID